MSFFDILKDPSSAMMLGGLGQYFGLGSKNPADSANEYLNKIPGTMSPYYTPYINSGKDALGKLQGEYGSLTSDPSSMYNKLAGGYNESPGFKFKLNQALNAGNNAQAAGGMLGTPQHEQQNMQLANDISSKDFEDYLNHILGLYGSGLQGLGGLNEQGFKASTDMGSSLGSLLGQQAQYKYAGEAGENQRKSQGLSDIFGSLPLMFM